MNDLGKGIATAGIWIGVGIASINGNAGAEIAGSAAAATFFVWLFG